MESYTKNLIRRDELLALINLARHQDPYATNRICEMFWDYVLRTIVLVAGPSLGSNWIDHEDVCQGVIIEFLKDLHEKPRTFDNQDEIKRLLASIAKQRTIDAIRYQRAAKRDQRKTVSHSEKGSDLPVPGGDSPSSVLYRQEVRDLVNGQLDSVEKQIFEYRVYNNLTWNEIAEKLSLKPDAVRKKYERAAERLSHTFGKDSYCNLVLLTSGYHKQR